MQSNEQRLLLTVARILRARLRHDTNAFARDDYGAICAALAPFEAEPSEPINEELRV